MAGIYLHIPFCKQACTYCDFHFSTRLNNIDPLVDSMLEEIDLRSAYFKGAPLDSIYFGGGSPSVLSFDQLEKLIRSLDQRFGLNKHQEITLEANPDDFSPEKVRAWKKLGINRLSIGIQSFRTEDLELMNRAHSRDQAFVALGLASEYFPNFTADLIYGIPGMDDKAWKENIRTLLNFDPKHISAYALTIEPRTALEYQVKKKIVQPMSEEDMERQHRILLSELQKQGFEPYEISNFARPGFRAVHNSSYWHGKPYLGIGPSAHSFDGKSRMWNVENNAKYIKAIKEGILPCETEVLSREDKINEYIMTGLRLKEGLEIKRLQSMLEPSELRQIETQVAEHIRQGRMEQADGHWRLVQSAYFLADGIASDLFLI